ncbi:MAG: DNRLRE domain-containing protein [Phycisphaerales bacterium]|nr:DNRLRE domain-containing protein [Phycisphaerales bacterium]
MLARCSASSCPLAALPLLIALPASAALVTISATRDATLYESATGVLGNGAGQYLHAGTTNQPLLRRALIAFDGASLIPENALISSVTLTLHVSGASVLAHNFSLHRVTSPWTAGTSDASGNEGGGTAAVAGDATWLHASSPGLAWTAPGGDFSTIASAAQTVGDIGFYSWTSAQLTSDVQNWITTPTSNFGWILRGDESAPGTTRRFDSSESFDAALAPKLVIEYTVVPAPGSLALLALSLIVARKRRRSQP